MTTQSLSWTNSKPVDIIVHVSSCAKTTRESYEVTVEEWETSFDSSYETWGTKPANESAPSPANVGDTYYTYSKGANTGETITVDGVTYNIYTCKVYKHEYVESTETRSNTITGAVSVTNAGTAVSGTDFTVKKGNSVIITLSRPVQQHSGASGYSETSLDAGSVSVSWIESENYSAGVTFFKNYVRSFQLNSLNSGISTSSCTLTVNGATVLNLAIGSAAAWIYNSSYGSIYKLVRFSWSNSQDGSDSNFSSSAASYTDISLNYHSSGEFKSVAYSSTSVAVSGTAESFSLDTSTWVVAFSISFVCVNSSPILY